jgi:hypothetical protein
MRKIISTKKKLRISLLKTPEDKTLKSFRVRNRVYKINPATFVTLKD